MTMTLRVDAAADPARQDNVVLFGSVEDGIDAAGRDLPILARAAALRALGDFTGKLGATSLLYDDSGSRRWLLVGLGEKAKVNGRAWRAAGAAAQVTLAGLGAESATCVLPAGARVGELATGLLLSGYRYDRYLQSEDAKAKHLASATLVPAPGDDVAAAIAALSRAECHARGASLARDLMNGPGNAVTPSHLAAAATAIAAESGGRIRCRVLGEPELEAENCRAILAVGAGSAEESKLIVLEYAPTGKVPAGRTLALVGKGVTFDTGGISIKPAALMEEMKYDMGGAAAVLGVFRALAELDLPVKVVGLVPTVENMPDGRSYRPGDIVVTRSGLSIEIKNTDAEGRVILSDALDYAKDFAPDLLIDLATLTGACVVALAHEAAGLMANDAGEAFVADLRESGDRSGERVWPLPMYAEYEELIKSDVADMCNTGGRYGGAIAAAKLLQRFADHSPWIHLDIAGTAWTGKERDITPKGGNGFGVRLLMDFIEGFGS
ncbi:MAG: leucyl aminopeptidase [Candidatus Latescibacteria bacterium]|nr:leucyl aminopeptidase [bacterium]MCB9515317.1 leucyl aminopeptidase [Candidatus Latescibacterota bacterium]